MPVSPSPEPWAGPKTAAAKANDRSQKKASIYDANRKLVGWCIARTVEKEGPAGGKRHGAVLRRQRIVVCVNACQGIPNERLETEGILGMAVDLMRRACNFGDVHLQTLPDRIEANMRDIFASGLLNEEPMQ